jgi:hypothetical protein
MKNAGKPLYSITKKKIPPKNILKKYNLPGTGIIPVVLCPETGSVRAGVPVPVLEVPKTL